MEHPQDGGRARRQQRAVRTRVGAAVAAGAGFGAAVAAFAVHDQAPATTAVTSTGAVTTPTTVAPDLDQAPTFEEQLPDGLGATPGFGRAAPDSTSRGS